MAHISTFSDQALKEMLAEAARIRDYAKPRRERALQRLSEAEHEVNAFGGIIGAANRVDELVLAELQLRDELQGEARGE